MTNINLSVILLLAVYSVSRYDHLLQGAHNVINIKCKYLLLTRSK